MRCCPRWSSASARARSFSASISILSTLALRRGPARAGVAERGVSRSADGESEDDAWQVKERHHADADRESHKIEQAGQHVTRLSLRMHLPATLRRLCGVNMKSP